VLILLVTIASLISGLVIYHAINVKRQCGVVVKAEKRIVASDRKPKSDEIEQSEKNKKGF
jgi:hypothetical protein